MVVATVHPGLTWNMGVYEFIPGSTCIPFAPIQFAQLTIDGKPLATTLGMTSTDLWQCDRIAAHVSPFNTAGKGFKIRYQPA